MKKLVKLLSILFFISFTFVCFASEIAEQELNSVADKIVVFENYTGPHTRIDSLEQIKEIGTTLASNFDKNVYFSNGNKNKYSVIHIVDSTETEKLEADIITLGFDVEVDHIRNVRHIVASYLEAAYGYDYKDAYTIATFVTVYNAVYRQNFEYFSSKYKEEVLTSLDEQKVGLSTSYKEWADNSQIVIPLGQVLDGLSSIETSVISDKNVVESLREEDDKEIEQRQNMTELKEREAENANQKAQDAQKNVTQEEKILQEEKKSLANKLEIAEKSQKQAKQDQETADKKTEIANKNSSNEQAQKEAAQAQKKADKSQKTADQDKKNVQEQQKKVKEQEKKTKKEKKDAALNQTLADKKKTESQTEKAQIQKDKKQLEEQKLIEETSAIFALKLIDSKNLFSAVVKLDKTTGKELKTSKVKVIRNRIIFDNENNFIAIAGESGKTQAVKLVQLDKAKLEIIKESDAIIAENSLLVKESENYYAVVIEDTKNYLANFNSLLDCVAKSDVEVQSGTPILINAEGICVTEKSGKIVILNAIDLTKK